MSLIRERTAGSVADGGNDSFVLKYDGTTEPGLTFRALFEQANAAIETYNRKPRPGSAPIYKLRKIDVQNSPEVIAAVKRVLELLVDVYTAYASLQTQAQALEFNKLEIEEQAAMARLDPKGFDEYLAMDDLERQEFLQSMDDTPESEPESEAS